MTEGAGLASCKMEERLPASTPSASSCNLQARHLLIGTAGHVDHGKTRLIEALTGIDCDRWEEEKRRGITIDLGFAHLEVGDLQLGFVDVPGHAKFLHNALAGLGGIRVVLLVVAADEGVKPQTREHLDICRLLDIPEAVVALTKCDLVDEETVALARAEIEELLAGGPYAAAPILPVSSRTGAGLDALRDALVATADRVPRPVHDTVPARLPVDRAFQLQGRGTIVTGTLTAGAIGAGDALEVLPGGATVRVRSVQVFGRDVDRALAGQRTALQLAGARMEDVARGAQLVSPGSLRSSARWVVALSLPEDAPAPLTGWTEARVHLLTTEVQGRVRPLAEPLAPGSDGAVELRLAAPVATIRGDRVILRRPSPPLTLGGGRILDPDWRGARGRGAVSAPQRLLEDGEAILLWADQAGEHGLDAGELAARLGVSADDAEHRLEALRREQRLLALPGGTTAPPRWIAPRTFERLSRRAVQVLEGHFRTNRLAAGMSKAEAAERLLTAAGRAHADVYLDWLARQGVLAIDGDRVDLPGRGEQLDERESRLVREIEERFRAAALAPPSPTDLRRQLEAKPQIVDGLIGYLIERGRLVRLPGGLLLSAEAVDELRRTLQREGPESFTVADFKQRFGLTRKWAIPLLEHLDSTGTTRRIGDRRQVVRR